MVIAAPHSWNPCALSYESAGPPGGAADESWSDDKRRLVSIGSSTGPAIRILSKSAGDVVEKCIKIFVNAGLEIHNGPSQDKAANPLAIVGSTKDEHTQFG